MATAGTAAPAPAPAPSTHSGGDAPRNKAARARMTISPGTMNAAPPIAAPARPRSRHAQKIASWVEAGPGSRLHAAMASSNSGASSHWRRSTHSSRSSLMWAGGPPNPMQPIRPHSRMIVARDTCGGRVTGAPQPGRAPRPADGPRDDGTSTQIDGWRRGRPAGLPAISLAI
jgi:hypothetical protein